MEVLKMQIIKPMYGLCLIGFLVIVLLVGVSNTVSADVARRSNEQASAYFKRPFLAENANKGIILLNIDQSADVFQRVYSSTHFQPLKGDGAVGYFKAQSQYRYDAKAELFEEDTSLSAGQKGAWDGQFLNWLLMSRLDILRYFLFGDNLRNDEGQADVLNLVSTSEYTLYDSRSQFYSPVPNFMPIEIGFGTLKFQNQVFQLRLKSSQQEKGLLNLLTEQTSLYYYGKKTIEVNKKFKQEFSFGELASLDSYLRTWEVNHKKTESRQSEFSETNDFFVFLKALEEIKKYSALNVDQKQKIVCQRYIHLSIGTKLIPIDMASFTKTESDCQKDLKGKQALTNLSLVLDDKHGLDSYKGFSFFDLESLKKVIFRDLYHSKNNNSYQTAGAQVVGFSDHSGVLYQALFKYSLEKNRHYINWLGELNAIFIDEQGRLRSDNGDKKLGTLQEDPILSSCFDERDRQLRFRMLQQQEPSAKCNTLNYPYLEEDVGYLWRASDSLNVIDQENITIQRTRFKSNERKRYIRTHIGQTEYDFVASEDNNRGYPINPEWLHLNSKKELDELVNYVRGEDQNGYRRRVVDSHNYLFGDTINHEPMIVGKPSSNYHLLYSDQSYQAFLTQYKNRRARVFIGTNDGVLHSFNAGWFDPQTRQIMPAPESISPWELGQETWAFVPESVLPHLHELRDKYYGVSPNHHLRLIPQTPYIFDARIFGNTEIKGQSDRYFVDSSGSTISQETHPEGWGTLMVVSAGLENSSYLVFDITDAEQAPTLLANITLDGIGQATSQPVVMTLKNGLGELEWYLVLGSGADNQKSPRVSYINLKDIQSSRLKTQAISEQKISVDIHSDVAFVTGMSSADWDMDGETDALYLNTANVENKSGSLYRLGVRAGSTGQPGFQIEKLLDAKAPLISKPQLSLDALNNRWIYLASGMTLKEVNNPGYMQEPIKHKIIGLKEPRNEQGTFLMDLAHGKSGRINLDSLLDTTDISVNSETGKLGGIWSLQPQLDHNMVTELEQRLISFSSSQEYIPGWVKYLDEQEASTGASKLFGGILSQATFKADYKDCLLEAEALVYNLRFTTGTSWISSRYYKNKPLNIDAELDTSVKTSGDSHAISSILLHESLDNVSQLQASQNGSLQTTSENMFQEIKQGEVSWREL